MIYVYEIEWKNYVFERFCLSATCTNNIYEID